MKKAYCKPQIAFEDFELCANVASGCEHKTSHWKNECAYEILGGYKVFVYDASGCVYKQQDGAYGVCYHLPIDTMNIFTS